jgi:GNAT superfamily N-acetyltransferase
MAWLPWTDQAKAAFLDSQFRLQHQHFTSRFAEADFLIVEERGAPVGRLYVDWGPPDALIVDIGLLPSRRGAGLGGALLGWVAGEAERAGAARVTLHVLMQNLGARRLYERRGYRPVRLDGAHLFMALPLSTDRAEG